MRVSSATLRRRISRSLVTILALSGALISLPVVAPESLTTPAIAAESSLIATNLTLNAMGSGLAANGIALVGSPSFTAGPPPYYLFNSDSKYGYKNIDYGFNSQVSIFMWVYPTAAGIILNHNGTTAQDSGWRTSMIDYTGSKFRFGLYDATTGTVSVEANVTTPINNWYFIGFTYSGGATRVLTSYVNGVATGSTVVTHGWATPGSTAGSGYFHIGSKSTNGAVVGLGTPSAATEIRGGGRFRLGQWIVYSGTQTAAEVQQNYLATQERFAPSFTEPTSATTFNNRDITFSTGACTSTSGAVCTYQWERSINSGSSWSTISGAIASSLTLSQVETSMSGYQYRVKVTDPGTSSPSTTALTITSAVATLTVNAQPGGDTDTALTFSTGKYAWAPDSNEFDIANAITIQAWVYQTESLGSSWNMVVNKESSYELGTLAGTWYFGLRSTGWTGKDTEVPTRYNVWQHVALTRASGSSTANFYVDGQLRWSGTADGALGNALANTTQPFTIGGRSGDGETFSSPFSGQIDELRVFNSARTASEIQSDMVTYGPINTPSLAVYYDFNEGTSSKLYNRVSGATSGSDLTVVNSPAWDGTRIESTTVSGAYTVKRFLRNYLTSNNGWKVPTDLPAISSFIVGGGGGGGYNSGGGGSGGGLVYTPRTIVSGTMTVTVGVGGEGASSTGAVPLAGFTTTFGTTTAAGGNPGGNYPTSQAGGLSVVTATGSSGAGGRGALSSTSSGTAGSPGLTSSITGTDTTYSGGGGGGGWNASTGGGAVGAGGGGAGGITNSRAGKNGTANSGGGGGAGSSTGFVGGDGGSGVIIIRWITAAKPIFTQPTNDTTTAGLTDTITVSADPISPLTRSYRWQVSTDTGTTWVNATSGSGITSNTYTTPILDTSTSGSRYQYRVVVTDSDTAGLFIVETSTNVFIVINPPIVFSGTFTSQKYGEGDSDTFTVLNGTGNKTFSYNPGTRPGITWSSPSANTAVVTVARTVSPGTYPETITATDTKGAQTQLLVSVVVTKADTITVTALDRSDTYTGSALTFTPTFTVVGLKNSDTVTPISWEYTGADNAGTAYSTSTSRPINAGSYTIDPITPVSLLDSYTAVTRVTSTLTINRATRTISMTTPASPLKYGDTRTAVATPSAGSGDGTISYLTSTSDSCTVISSTIRAVRSAGTCSFTATISRGNNFETATTTSAVTTTLTKADTITVQVRNPVTLTYSGSPAASLPTIDIVGLVHTDTATATMLYSHPASAVGAPESYVALTNSATTPTDVETYTVSSSTLTFSSGLATNYQNIVYETSTLIITQANQQPLRIAMYGAFVGSSYTIITDGGSGGGAVTEATTAGSSAENCSIVSRVLTMTSTVTSYCNILVTKGASRNFKVETTTAQITFYLFIPTVAAPAQGSGPNIALNGENTVTIDVVGAPTITSLSATTITLSAGGSLTIGGTGFGTSSLTVQFWREKMVTITPTNGTTIVVPFADIAASGGTSGRIMVITEGGIGVSVDRLTINP